MSRWRVFLATMILCATLALVASSPAQASSTLAKLRHARHDLRVAKHHLRHYRALLHALLAAQAAADSGSGTPVGTEVVPSPVPEVPVSPSPEPSASPFPELPGSPLPEPSPSPTPEPWVSPASDPLPSPTPEPWVSPTPESSPSPVPDLSPSPSPSPEATAAVDPLVPVVAATTVSPPPLTAEQLRARIVRSKARVLRLTRRVHRLSHRRYVERSIARGYYWPLVKDVARKNGVSATGIMRLMRFESGGRHTAIGGGGAYHGLFQYAWRTWGSGWNPWRMRSIYDPAAQIRATAHALRLGYGPSMWPHTYWLSF